MTIKRASNAAAIAVDRASLKRLQAAAKRKERRITAGSVNRIIRKALKPVQAAVRTALRRRKRTGLQAKAYRIKIGRARGKMYQGAVGISRKFRRVLSREALRRRRRGRPRRSLSRRPRQGFVIVDPAKYSHLTELGFIHRSGQGVQGGHEVEKAFKQNDRAMLAIAKREGRRLLGL